MAFADSEVSVERSRPVELYTISQGTEQFFYTSQEQAFTVGATTYNPVPLRRGRIASGPDSRDGIVEVEIPGNDTFARRYINVVPAQRATVTIDRVQRLEGTAPADIIRVFEGVVQSVAFTESGKLATLALQPVVASLSRPLPRETFSSGCNHILYDALTCQAVRGSTAPDSTPLRLVATVTGVSGIGNTELTVPGAAALPTGWFTAGQITLPGDEDTRMVINHSGSTIQLLLGFRVAVTGLSMTLDAGCAHDPNACVNKFGNFINYGGSPFVPDRNIFRTGIG